MIIQRKSLRLLAACVAIAVVGIATPQAHEMMYRGTVVEVQATKVAVKTTDDKTKKTETVWLTVNRDTKVKRGDVLVPYGEAHIAKDERIVVIVNHDAETKMLATEIRLAAAK
jgi:sulfate adenylyltransferase subunit 1 (EFTu-like GTPase family)